MKDDNDLNEGKISGKAKNDDNNDAKISGKAKNDYNQDGKISGASIDNITEVTPQKKPEIKKPATRKERIATATLTGGLNELPSNFGDSDGDWITMESSDNLFEFFYLDHTKIESISPQIISKNYNLIYDFWKKHQNLWETEAIREKIQERYGKENLKECLKRLDNAYNKLSTLQGIKEYYNEFRVKRLKDCSNKLNPLLSLMVKDGEAEAGELQHIFEEGSKLEFSDEEISSVLKGYLDANKMSPYGGALQGESLKEKLFSVSWLNEEKRIQRQIDDEEKKKRGREILAGIYAYGIEDIGRILYENEKLAKEFIEAGLIINTIDYFNPAKAMQIRNIIKHNKHLEYLETIYCLNPKLPFKFKNKDYTEISELAKAFFDDMDWAIHHIATGNVEVWLKYSHEDWYEKFIEIKELTSDVKITFLHFIYTLSPELPYRFGNQFIVNTPEELSSEITKSLDSWECGINELYDESIPVWLEYKGLKKEVDEWHSIKDTYHSDKALGLEGFLHILNKEYEYPQIKVDKKEINFSQIQSGDTKTVDLLFENATRGYAYAYLTFSENINGVSLSNTSMVFNSAANINKISVRLQIKADLLLNGADYKTVLRITISTGQRIEIPITFKITFPRREFLKEIAIYSVCVGILFSMYRFIISLTYPDWLLKYDKFYLGWDYVSKHYSDYSEFGWTFLLMAMSVVFGIFLIKKLVSMKAYGQDTNLNVNNIKWNLKKITSGIPAQVGCFMMIFILFILLVLGYVIYSFGPPLFSFFGFNTNFFLDNIFQITAFNPTVVWGIMGLLFGSILGVYAAIKKLHLKFYLFWYPVVGVFLVLLILGLINEPLHHNIKSELPKKIEVPQKVINQYIVKSKSNIYKGPSINSKKQFQLKKGDIVELIEANIRDKRKNLWSKISYNGNIGFIESKNIEFTKTESQDASGYYPGKYPESSARYLTSSDLSNLSQWELKIMRNEIFARHGFIFQTQEMKKYFSNQSWYKPTYHNVDHKLNEIEKENIALISRFEK